MEDDANLEPAELEVPVADEQEADNEQPDDEQPDDELSPDDDGAAAHADEDDKPVSRREQRIQKLANERAEAQAEAKRQAEMAEFYRKQAEEMQRRNAPPVEEQFVDPDEKWRKDTEAKVNQVLFSANDLNDKAAYTLAAAKNPLHAKYEAKVEQELQAIRAKGGNATREGVLAYLVGSDAIKNHGKPTKSAQAAQKRVADATTKPGSVKSNVSAPKNEKSLEERLTGVIL